MQKQQRVRHQQEEPNGMQSMPTQEVSDGWHVKERFSLRPPIELVQDSLSAAGAAATARATPVESSSPATRSHVSQSDGRLQQE